MDEDVIREHATKHGEATVAGDFKTAGRDLTPEAAGQAPDVMKAMPNDLSSSDIASIDKDGDSYVVVIDYSGAEDTTRVESTWAVSEGRPRITNLKVV